MVKTPYCEVRIVDCGFDSGLIADPSPDPQSIPQSAIRNPQYVYAVFLMK
jgi:hypothetical protein